MLGVVLVGFFSLQAILFRLPFPVPGISKGEIRDSRLDQIRGLAMIGIVLIHIHSYFAFFHPNEPNITHWTLFLSNLSRFSVPVFIFGSSLYLKKKDDYWKSKVFSLFLPYLAASIAGYFIKYDSKTILDFIFKLSVGQVFAPYYFVPLLFQFYIIFYLIPERLLSGINLRILTVVCVTLNFLSNVNLLNPFLPDWYHSISVFNYCAFFAFGLLIKDRKIIPSVSKNSSVYLLILFTFGIGLVVLAALSFSGVEVKNHHLFYPVFGFLILNRILPVSDSYSFNKALSFIGRNSLFIFLLHPFVIHSMHKFDPLSFGGPVLGYMITLILNVGIPCTIASVTTARKERLSNR
ncbi:acyltransferase family protein [Leptospira idonii]|nr:acyltransferase [Leptospira idonii]